MKKTLSLILALMLIFALVAGCSNNTASEPENSPAASSEPSTESSKPIESSEPEPVDPNQEFTKNYTPIDWGDSPATDVQQDILTYDMVAVSKNLPLVSEKVNLTAWWPMSNMEATYLSNYNDAPNMQEIENRTNIHVDFFQPSTAELESAFPLMVASDDYCDMIFYADYYTGGGDKAIEDGVYIRLNELIE